MVVLPAGRDERLQADLDQYRVRLGWPPADQVLRRYLRMDGIHVEELPQVAEQYLGGRPAMSEIAAYAALILEARGDGRLDDWCKIAYDALTRRDSAADTKFEQHTEGPERALLLVVAMLDGANADLVHTAHRHFLASFVMESTKPPLNPRLRAAAQALRLGLEDTTHGSYFRKQIYDWSRVNALQRGLAHVLIEACREVMALHHPDQAMVRLHHIARRERATTRAREAFLELVRSDVQIHRRALDRLHQKFQETNAWALDPILFLELADPAALTDPGERGRALADDAAFRDQLAADWSTVFDRVRDEEWSPRAGDWLQAAASSAEPRAGTLLKMLIAGNGRRPAVLSRLYVLAPARIRDRVLHEINFAQEVVS